MYTAVSYAYQLQSLRAFEKRFSKDFTPQAIAALTMRQNAIEGMDVPDEVKQRLLTNAQRQWAVFMQRPIPANG